MIELEPTDSKKIVIVRKWSVLEYEMQKFDKSAASVIESFRLAGADYSRIQSSHDRQLETFDQLAQLLPQASVVVGETLKREDLSEAEFVISLGGDDHFKYVSHFIDDQPIIGVNSDSMTSDGALTYFDAESFGRFLPHLLKGQFSIEKWTRLEVLLNDQPAQIPVTSELFIGARENDDMSRYMFELGQNPETKLDLKNSGLIITTGVGSTGWYKSAGGKPFPKDADYARVLFREQYEGPLTKKYKGRKRFNSNETVTVTSLMNKSALLSLDSRLKIDFPRGTVVRVGISAQPLRVVCQSIC